MTPDERASLLDSLLDGDISEADFLRIEAELSVDASVRQEYYRRLELDLLLEREALESSPFCVPDKPLIKTSATPGFPISAGWLVALAATVLAIVALVPRQSDPGPSLSEANVDSSANDLLEEPDRETSASGFAVLSGQSDAVWASGKLENGSLLPEGELHLRSGMIHVELFSGVQMVIQGDAVFSIDSPMQATMLSGRARANVPEPAHGFRVKTSDGEVVDLGTEFTIDVGTDGSSVQVVDGEVELHPRGSGSRRLIDGQSLRLTKDGLKEKNGKELSIIGPADFQTELAQLQLHQYARWQSSRESLRHDPRLVAYYQVDPDEGWSRRLKNLANENEQVAGDGAVVAAERTEDRWGRRGAALDFSRMGSRVRVAVPGQHRGLSMFCWVKINSLDRKYNSLFLTDGHEDLEPHWQILNDGRIFFSVKSPGDFRVPTAHRKNRVYYSKAFWNASLSGRWIMLCTVYDVDRKQVVHYVNGQPISREEIPDQWLFDSIKIGAASICNWSEPMYSTDPNFVVRNLNGSLDEFALFSGALSSEEVVDLFQNGNPHQ